MVQVKSYALRESENGEFISLELEGDLELVQSQNTGRYYATTRRCWISSTFDENTARLMVGKTLSGKITRIQCEPYEYTLPETGEIITLGYRWDYTPEEAVEQKAFGLVSA